MNTPAYDAWMRVQQQAAELERLLRESQVRVVRDRKRRALPDSTAVARAAELQKEAAALFAEAMKEMNDAVEDAISDVRLRLH